MAAPRHHPPAVESDAHIFIIDSFVIEAYPSISEVPYASVSEQRGKALKTSQHERLDELYGRCRTCMGHKAGEQLLLCDDCDRGFHMTCLVPVLREVPKGEWHCAKCARERLHGLHRRATAVADLKKIMADVANRPVLPLKVRVKLLDVAAPVVEAGRMSRRDRGGDGAPPRCRLKRERMEGGCLGGVEEAPVCLIKTSWESVRKRVRGISMLAGEIVPIARLVGEGEAWHSMKYVQDELWRRCYYVGEGKRGAGSEPSEKSIYFEEGGE